ncbi:MAG TPA: hypothetical protein VN207_04740 [Ktedonobacteraceae bacterium]|nr:hypothetical protein [Ktedonobacteraceae bacterium]
MVVQLKMGSQLEAVIGMQAALTVTLLRFPRGVVATVGQQQWIGDDSPRINPGASRSSRTECTR